MKRRTLLFTGTAGLATMLAASRWITTNDANSAQPTLIASDELDAKAMPIQTPSSDNRSKDNLSIDSPWQDFAPPNTEFPVVNEPLILDNSEWQQKLDSNAYKVLRQEGTERPFSSSFNDNKTKGLYTCAGCDLPLFTSAMKFDSGTGWPSFFTSIEGHLGTKKDFKLFLPRTEYHCTRCGGHQGHVFKDGPQPTGERWCNNGIALKFIPAYSV